MQQERGEGAQESGSGRHGREPLEGEHVWCRAEGAKGLNRELRGGEDAPKRGGMSTPETASHSEPRVAPVSAPATFVEKAESFAREKPAEAMGAALGAGILLALLPVGAIVGALVRMAAMLVRPLLVVLGLVKLYEVVGGRCCSGGDAETGSEKSRE